MSFKNAIKIAPVFFGICFFCLEAVGLQLEVAIGIALCFALVIGGLEWCGFWKWFGIEILEPEKVGDKPQITHAEAEGGP